MERFLFVAAVVMVSAIAIPQFMPFMDATEAVEVSEDGAASAPAVDVQGQDASTRKASYNPLDGRRAVLDPNGHGQFVTEARINGERMQVLVDTGATYVAMNESAARKIGIRLKDGHFRHGVKTANGTIHVALAKIDSIEIGRVRVEDVDVAVMRDEASDMILLGMSFLKKLKNFAYDGDALVLNQ